MLRLTSLPLLLRLALVAAAFAVLALASLEPRLAPPSAHHADLWLHGAAYGALTTGLVALFASPVACALAAFAVSGVLEILQGGVPGRSASWEDALANAAGIALALIVLLCLRLYLAARPSTQHPD